MIDLLLKLIDQLTKLVKIREMSHREYFQLYVKPTYDSAEAIYRDYRSLLQQLRVMLDNAESPEPIIAFLEERREGLLPARDLLRAMVAQRVKEGHSTRFEAGVLGLMTGAVTGVDRPYYSSVFYQEKDGIIESHGVDHTVLDILHRIKAYDHRDFSSNRRYMQGRVDQKMHAIEMAWQNVVRGYAEMQASAMPAMKVRESRHLTRASGVARMRALMGEVQGMIASNKFSRKPATDLEKVAATAVPEVLPLAQEIRGTVHDLYYREPNITVAELKESLSSLEQALTTLVK